MLDMCRGARSPSHALEVRGTCRRVGGSLPYASGEGASISRIVRFHRIGGPKVLQFDELDLRAPAAEEVRMRVRTLGLERASRSQAGG